MEKSETIGGLASALAKVQAQIKHPQKNRTAGMGKYSYKYADLAEVIQSAIPLLSANGLAVVQCPSSDGPAVTLETMLVHECGEYIISRLTMTAKDDSPQAIGATITYARRYSFSSIIGVVADEDDDAQSAQPSIKPAVATMVPYGAVRNGSAPAAVVPAVKKVSPSPTGFDSKVSTHVEALADLLQKKSIGMEKWPQITTAMQGKRIADLDRVIGGLPK